MAWAWGWGEDVLARGTEWAAGAAGPTLERLGAGGASRLVANWVPTGEQGCSILVIVQCALL